jgi:transmembrane sensor
MNPPRDPAGPAGAPEPDDSIEEVAADWLTLRAEGFSSAQKRDFERWCRADPRHASAVARLEAACALLEKMPQVRAELQPVIAFPAAPRSPHAVARAAAADPAPSPPRAGRVWRLALGLAAAVALAAIGVWQWPRFHPAAALYATSAGGYERVVLADGSVLELNAASEVRVVLAPAERRVALVRGEAHFTVAPDPARPFVVSAAGVAVRAVGTAFNVRLATSAVEVLVTEGKVSVSDVGPALAAGPSRSERDNRDGLPTTGSPTLLSANERTLISLAPAKSAKSASPPLPAPVVEPVAPDALREALSWQERKLVFSETPLRDVVAQFNRRNRTQLLLGDASLAERPVGGTFAADNVEGFIRLLEGSGSITVERRDDATVVLRTAP